MSTPKSKGDRTQGVPSIQKVRLWMTLICDRANTVPYSRQFSQSQPVTLYPTYSDFLAENCESLNTTSNLLEYERYFVLKNWGHRVVKEFRWFFYLMAWYAYCVVCDRLTDSQKYRPLLTALYMQRAVKINWDLYRYQIGTQHINSRKVCKHLFSSMKTTQKPS